MTSRRDFLRKTGLALAGGLLFGEAALEAVEALASRQIFASASLTTNYYGRSQIEKMLQYQAQLSMKAVARSISTQFYGDFGGYDGAPQRLIPKAARSSGTTPSGLILLPA